MRATRKSRLWDKEKEAIKLRKKIARYVRTHPDVKNIWWLR